MTKTAARSHFDDVSRHPTTSRDREWVIGGGSRRGKPLREVTIQVGRSYVVSPRNPRSKKNRGRPCTIVELDDGYMPSVAAVQFTDSKGRIGKVRCSDLVEPGQAVDPAARDQLWDLDEIRRRAARLGARLAEKATPARLGEFRTLANKIGMLIERMPATRPVLEQALAEVTGAAAVGLSKQDGRSPEEMLKLIVAEAKRQLAH